MSLCVNQDLFEAHQLVEAIRAFEDRTLRCLLDYAEGRVYLKENRYSALSCSSPLCWAGSTVSVLQVHRGSAAVLRLPADGGESDHTWETHLAVIKGGCGRNAGGLFEGKVPAGFLRGPWSPTCPLLIFFLLDLCRTFWTKPSSYVGSRHPLMLFVDTPSVFVL